MKQNQGGHRHSFSSVPRKINKMLVLRSPLAAFYPLPLEFQVILRSKISISLKTCQKSASFGRTIVMVLTVKGLIESKKFRMINLEVSESSLESTSLLALELVLDRSCSDTKF
uniref:(northern house mosquito) hypothetical protein n=1 Tax=Culex pipiens TaxID=7175 RepID=A0A8D8AT37_CULPI